MTEQEEKQISTSALAKKHKVPGKDMFLRLQTKGLIERKGDYWSLTNEGVKRGGRFVEHKKYGKYITWPEGINIDVSNGNLITSTVIGKEFGLSANKINFILSEIGWIYKGIKGWLTTPQGVQQGGEQDENKKSGVPYVRWPSSIIESKVLLNSINQMKGAVESIEPKEEDVEQESQGFREKFVAKLRSADGHYVRSKAEMLIDNWLYMAEIVHAYERKLPIEEDVYSDFYLPTGKVYIEYWGIENDRRYSERKAIKQEIYKKYRFNLIELTDKEVQNLDDILPRLLLKYKIQSF
ncbi:hypothetical protein [Desulfogranum marinum]|uniref:hypothetical protein n=1 Tax=Desulfogranum marinum TaxID=453220 RepID=UPI0029C7F774|nr:hypothetical protein [Desulfogranum marinum]